MSDHLLFRRKKNRQQFLSFSPPDEGKQHLHISVVKLAQVGFNIELQRYFQSLLGLFEALN